MPDGSSPRATSNNLPLQLTSFIGRERETAEVKKLLTTTRLLTLMGPGGCGKTRLALRVAADLVPGFADGVWWVELAPLSDAALVSQAVASAVGAREASGRPLTETLVEYLRPRTLLLVLDNCEHLVAACAEFAELLLRACPQLRILTTSREALSIAGETSYLVPSLALPAAQTVGDAITETAALAELGRTEAVRLFVERAMAVLPAFRLTEQNAPAVVQVCQRLDGVPLAIELAAARVRVLPVEQIAARLDDSIRLLTAGSRTALPRHQTLRATIEWSYDLLAEQERTLFRRLAVFAGGFTLDAIDAICAEEGGHDDAWSPDILDLVAALVDKSLVVMQERDGRARYRLLETIRQYGSGLLEPGEEATGRRRHARFYLALAEEVEPHLNDPDRRPWLERLEIEHENLRAALRWALTTSEAETALRLAAALWWFWFHRGFWSEGRAWLAQALATPFASTEEDAGAGLAVRSRALLGAGVLAWASGDHAAALPVLEKSVAIARRLGDKNILGHALQFLAQEMLSHGEPDAASSLAAEAVKLSREMGDVFCLGGSLVTAALAAQFRGDSTAARSMLEESVSILRSAGDAWTLALALRNLGYLALRQGDYERAATLQIESLLSLRDLGEQWFVSRSLEALAEAVAMQGDAERAARLFGASEALREAIGASVLPYYRGEYERGVAAARAPLGEAAFAAAWAEGRAMTMEQAIEFALALGETVRGKVRVGEAGRRLVALPASPPPPVAPASTLRIFALGWASVQRGDHRLAPADWSSAKPRELLFYLLSHPAQTKEQIGLALWPDASPAQLRSSFHVTLHHLRRALGQREWIVFENNRYVFNRELDYWFDVEAFESALAEARRLVGTHRRSPVHGAGPPTASGGQQAADNEQDTTSHEQRVNEAICVLQEAIKLYQGDFLEDFGEGDWVLLRREELQRVVLEALQTLGRLLAGKGCWAEAAEAYRQAIARDNLLEAAHRELMRCYARLGERGQALRHYQALVELLDEELGAPPAPETTALFERLRRGEEG